jgi:hypothetical protein
LKEKGFSIGAAEEMDLSKINKNVIENISSALIGKQNKADELDYQEIVRLAGDPIPEDERRKCPNCDAVISIDTIRCEWCGKNL